MTLHKSNGSAYREDQPLIRAAFGPLICADQRNTVSGNQRFLFGNKIARVKLNPFPAARIS